MGQNIDRGDYQFDFYYTYFVCVNGHWSSPYNASTQYETENLDRQLYDEKESGTIDDYRQVYTSFDNTSQLLVWEKCVCNLANDSENIDYAIETLVW